MILSIITINYNNAQGLEKTLKSVLTQTNTQFEHVIVDGASTDNSVELINQYEKDATARGVKVDWVSEKDKGIYNAMNKGILKANREYVQFLNSGDILASATVVEEMYKRLEENNYPEIMYGNMLKDKASGVMRDRCFAGQEISFLGFYTGTLNHSPAYIKCSLFDKFGLYDENLKIVSDWKWYLKSIILGGVKPVYVDIDVTLFDMNGISETNKSLDKAERKQVLSELIPKTFLSDYDNFSFPIDQIKRLKRHPWAYKMVWFLERVLFKFEKWGWKNKMDWEYR